MWIFCLFGESVCFMNFYAECFKRGKEAKKMPKKGQEGGQKSNKRRLKEGQNEDMISLFHMYMNVDFFFNLGKVFIM